MTTPPEPIHAHLAPDDPRRTSPAAARNRAPLLAVLRTRLTRPAHLLEIASGTGEHALWLSTALPHITWQPTDLDPGARASIEAWRTEAGPNLLPPLPLDASSSIWPIPTADIILSCNMIHIAPWSAALGLMAGAARILPPGGTLFLYGPFKDGSATAPGNTEFDIDLRTRNPEWGVRDISDVAALAERHGLQLHERIPMPANNLVLVFRLIAA